MTTATVLTDGLNLRDTPGGRVSDQLSKGDVLEVLEHRVSVDKCKRKYEWLRVKVKKSKVQGWVYARYVKIDKEPEKVAPEPKLFGPIDWVFWSTLVLVAGLIWFLFSQWS